MLKNSVGRLAREGLRGVSETLLIPLYYRALETRRPDALLRDERAAALVEALDFDFSRFKVSDQAVTMLRAREFDRLARAFLAGHPGGVVVDAGCGLDTRLYRVDDGCVDWHNLDLPEVIALRRDLLKEEEGERVHFIAGSVLDLAWLKGLQANQARGVLVLAEGVFPYFDEADVRSLVLGLKEQIPGAELVFDAMSPLLRRLHNLELMAMRVDARLHWAVKEDRALEEWGEGIHLREAWHYFDRPEPRLGFSNLFRYLPPLGKGAKILHYQLGKIGA